MFDELYVPAPPNSQYSLLLQADRKGVTAYLLASDISKFPLIQKQLSKAYEKEPPLSKVPIFYYKVQIYGSPIAKKSTLEEQLNLARLDSKINFKNAFYVSLNPKATERIPIALIGNSQEDWERVFLAEQMENQVIKAGDLKKYNMGVGMPDSQEVVLKIEGSQLIVYEIASKNSGRLFETDRVVIDSGIYTQRIRSCSSVKSLADRSDCVLIGRYKIDVSRVRAKRNTVDIQGELGSQVDFPTDQSREVVGLLKIPENPVVTGFPLDGSRDPRTHYQLKDLLGTIPEGSHGVIVGDKDFYFKRTLQEYPGQVGIGLFKGTSGGLMMVNFTLEEGRINVVRTDLSVNLPHSQESGKETVMSLPAEYYREVTTDNQGYVLTMPRLESASYSDVTDETYIKIDWRKSEVFEAGSILTMYGGGKKPCFFPSRDKQVIQLDNRLNQDSVLSFTIQGTYRGKPQCFYGLGWASVSNYYSTIDSNFDIKERFSFKEVNPDDHIPRSFGIPEMAEKAFAYGSITIPKRVYNEYGNASRSHEIEYNPIIYDFHRGQPMKWYIQGIPKNFTYYQEAVDAVGDVFVDLNDKFRRAFKGTSLETTKDLFEYEIVPEGSQDVVVGDLDKNIIIFEPQPVAFGAYGVYWSIGSPNPRSGKVVHSNVTVFAGNMKQRLEPIRRSYEIKKRKIDKINKHLEQFSKDNNVLLTIDEIMRVEEERLEKERNSNSLATGLLRGAFGEEEGGNAKGKVREDALSRDDDYIQVRLQVKEGGPFYHLTKKFKNNFVIRTNPSSKVGVNDGSSTTYVHPLQGFPEALKSVSARLKVASSKEKNISDILKRGVEEGTISPEEYSYTLYQRIVDRHSDRGNMSGLMNDSLRFKSAFLEEFLSAPSPVISKRELEDVFAEYTELKGLVNFMDQSDRLGMAYCFDQFDQVDLGDDAILTTMTDGEVFKSIFSNTTQHEILHALGLDHQFEGSVDHANHEFEGENTGRMTSGVLEYGSLTARANWRGMGPHDVHAIRAMYTGMVEANPQAMNPTRTKIVMESSEGDKAEIPVYDHRLVNLKEFKEVFLKDVNWLDLSKELIDQSEHF